MLKEKLYFERKEAVILTVDFGANINDMLVDG